MNLKCDGNLTSAEPIRFTFPPEVPEFHGLKEIEDWFDKNFCNIDHVVITAPGVTELQVQARTKAISEAVSPVRLRKAEWLRKDGNEAWYGSRIALVHSTWNVLKARHDEIVCGHYRERSKVGQELEYQKEQYAKLLREFNVLEEAKEQQDRQLAAAGSSLANMLNELPTSIKKLLPKTLLVNFREIVTVVLKHK